MGRHERKAHQGDAQAARRNRRHGQGRAVPPPTPTASASLPVGNAVPAQRQESLPEQGLSGPPRVPVQAHSRENDLNDRVQFSVTDVDGSAKTWSFSGVDRASRALCRPILSCGVVVALIVVPIVCVLAHSSLQEKVICGLGSAVVGGFVWIGTQVKGWLSDWRQKRRDKASAGDAGRG